MIRAAKARGLLLLLGLALLSLSLQGRAEQTTLRILPLGDSITQAEINRASYRYPLWKKLLDADIKFDFVGSMNTQLSTYSQGETPQPDYLGRNFDTDHEGHFAWQISDILNGRNPGNGSGSGNLSQWLEAYDFDIVLVHLGSNDAFYRKPNKQVAKELSVLINTLRADNQNAIILLAQIIPTSRRTADAEAIANMNKVIPEVIKAMNTPASPVILVDHFSDFDASLETYDGVHPNAAGEKKMAERWFNAIMDLDIIQD